MTIDFIGVGRRAQLAIATQLADAVRVELLPPYRQRVRALVGDLPIDEEAAGAMFESDLKRDSYSLVQAYSDWLATNLFRRFLRANRPLNDVESVPPCTGDELAAVAARSGVDEGTVGYLIEALTRLGPQLPFLGSLTGDGKIRVDSTQLNEWAKHYSW